MTNQKNTTLAVANQKGGVGKTTTTINLAHALKILDPKARILMVDLDPQSNTTQASGLKNIDATISELIRDRSFPEGKAIYKTKSFDIIPSTGLLSQVQREMVGITNSELRFTQRLKTIKKEYSHILIDTPPTTGPLLNSALNAAGFVIIPVDPGGFALQGVKSLLGEIEEIRAGTNPNLTVLGYLLTLCDATNITNEVRECLKESFGPSVFKATIRRSVRLREAPAMGKSIFEHAPNSSGADDYLALATEVIERIKNVSASQGGVK